MKGKAHGVCSPLQAQCNASPYSYKCPGTNSHKTDSIITANDAASSSKQAVLSADAHRPTTLFFICTHPHAENNVDCPPSAGHTGLESLLTGQYLTVPKRPRRSSQYVPRSALPVRVHGVLDIDNINFCRRPAHFCPSVLDPYDGTALVVCQPTVTYDGDTIFSPPAPSVFTRKPTRWSPLYEAYMPSATRSHHSPGATHVRNIFGAFDADPCCPGPNPRAQCLSVPVLDDLRHRFCITCIFRRRSTCNLADYPTYFELGPVERHCRCCPSAFSSPRNYRSSAD